MRFLFVPGLAMVSFLALGSLATLADDAIPTLEIGVLDSESVLRIGIDIQCGDQNYAQAWDAKFSAIVAYADTDQSGSLGKEEVSRLPSSRALREASCSGFAPVIGQSPTWQELDSNQDNAVSLDEVAAYYRAQNVGRPVVGIGAAPFTEDLNAALYAALDADANGEVSLAEWQAAESILERMDQNDDQMVGAGELVAGIVYPGTSGSFILAIDREGGPHLADSLAQFPLAILPDQPDDIFWTRRWSDQGMLPKRLLSADAVGKWRNEPIDYDWKVSITESNSDLTLSGVGIEKQSGTIPCLALGHTRLTVRADAGQLQAHIAAFAESTRDRFQEADKNQDGHLSQEEWSSREDGFGTDMVAMLDQDGNSQVSQAELGAWLTLQQVVGDRLVMITIIDCGNGVLELLDTDRNGALSRRELREAAARLEVANCLVKGNFNPERLPRQVLVTVSLGPPDSPLGKIQRQGPDWFLSMDRNLDGDVSIAEFVGGPEAFQSLDINGDQLITVEEVKNLAD